MNQQEPQYPIFRRQTTYEQNAAVDNRQKPSIIARGIVAPDPFKTRLESTRIQYEQQLGPQELKEMKFQKTDNQVYYRKEESQGSLLGVEVKMGPHVVKTKTTAQYLSEGLRTISIQMRDMLTDLNQLKKLLAKEEFQETSFFA